MTELSVPQSSWPLFAEQARTLAGYIAVHRVRPSDVPTTQAWSSFPCQECISTQCKGQLFATADAYHVEPERYVSRLQMFRRTLHLE